MEQARMAIFEVYCRIHQCIDLNMLSERLGMERTEAEKWIATLIRNARLNARCARPRPSLPLLPVCCVCGC